MAEVEASRQVLRVLLVEDDAGDALLVAELLADVDAPIELTVVSSITAAQPLLDDHECVLLDLGLPDASGLEALAMLDGANRQLAVVVLTGLADERQGIAAVAAGAQDYLVKGQVDGDLLSRVIRYAVERVRSEEIQRQLREARLHAMEKARLERGLLPSPVLTDERLVVSSCYLAGRERMLLGGDFYDVVQAADGTVHAIVGDVCGHGPDEAALGVCLRVAWRAMVLAGRPVNEVFATMQLVLVHERHLDGLFATACMVSVAPDRRSAQLHLVGHPPPVLCTSDAKCVLLSAPVGVPLGVLPDAVWTPATVELGDEWSLLLYTDGLVEGRVDESPERLGSDRLVHMVGAAATEPDWQATVLDRLLREVRVLNKGDLIDDVAALLLSRVPDEG